MINAVYFLVNRLRNLAYMYFVERISITLNFDAGMPSIIFTVLRIFVRLISTRHYTTCYIFIVVTFRPDDIVSI